MEVPNDDLQQRDLQQRLGFIDRTIDHALLACSGDASVPDYMRRYVGQLEQGCSVAQRALQLRDLSRIRQSVDELTRISHQAQTRIHPADGMNYALKSAVILTHIELSALSHQLDE